MHITKGQLALAGAAAAALLAAGCAVELRQAPKFADCSTAACYLSTVSEAQWAEAAARPVSVNFDKLDANGTPADYTITSPNWSDPANRTLVFETGKAYVLKFRNRYSSFNNTAGGDSEHYFTSPEFYKSIVVRKIVTPTATYTAPYLNDFELNAPAHNNKVDTEAEIHFVAVKAGVFPAVCKPGEHSDYAKRAGMWATLQIVGKSGANLDFDLPKDYPAALGDPKHALKGIGYASNAKDTEFWRTLPLAEQAGGVAMQPLALQGYAGQPGYKGTVLRLRKAEGSTGNWTLTSDFFKTLALRKVHDPHVQIKPVLLTSIEFAAGPSAVNGVNASKPGRGEIDLFMVPTVAGAFDFQFKTAAATSTGRVLVK